MRVDHGSKFIGPLTLLLLTIAPSASAGVPGPRRSTSVEAPSQPASGGSRVELPERAASFVRVHGRDGFDFGFRLVDAIDVGGAGGRFEKAVAIGAGRFDLRLREVSGGVEDFVEFPTRPAVESIAYEVDVSRAAGLRLVGGVLEMLDAEGTPRARMRAPYLIDAAGARHEASVALRGCAADRSGVAPWHRPITSPGASSCLVEIRWGAAIGEPLAYPAILDPAWVDGGTLVYARNAHTATLLTDGTVLIAGGYLALGTSSYTAVAELFDPTTSTWAATQPMVRPRAHFGSVMFTTGPAAGRVLMAGGDDSLLPTAEIFDPATGAWRATTSMKVGRDGVSVALLADGTAMAAGGCSHYGSTCDALEASAEVYDPGADTWSATAEPMSESRTVFALTALGDGRVIATGGCNVFASDFSCTSTSTGSDVYDPATGGWTRIALSAPMQNHRAVVLASGDVLAAGGTRNGVISRSSQIFDPTTNAWAITGGLQFAHDESALALTGSGKALFAGSWGTEGGFGVISRSAETFDPLTKVWTATTPLDTAHGDHTATTLADGRVLVAGGFAQPMPNTLYESGIGEVFDEAAMGGGGAGGGTPASTSASVGSTGPSGPGATTGPTGPGATTGGGGPGPGAGGAGGAGGSANGDSGSTSGCGCRVAGDAPEGEGLALALALAAITIGRRGARRMRDQAPRVNAISDDPESATRDDGA